MDNVKKFLESETAWVIAKFIAELVVGRILDDAWDVIQNGRQGR